MKLLVAALIIATLSCQATAQVVTTDTRSILWLTSDATCADVNALFGESVKAMKKIKTGSNPLDWQLSPDGLAFSALISYIAGYAASAQKDTDRAISYFEKVCDPHPDWQFDYAMRN